MVGLAALQGNFQVFFNKGVGFTRAGRGFIDGKIHGGIKVRLFGEGKSGAGVFLFNKRYCYLFFNVTYSL